MTNTIRLKITCFLLLFTVLLIKDILDLAWHLATRMKFGTCEQNWDLYGTISGLWSQLGPSPKFGTSLRALFLLFGFFLFRDQIFRNRDRDFFPRPNFLKLFSPTKSSETVAFYLDQIFRNWNPNPKKSINYHYHYCSNHHVIRALVVETCREGINQILCHCNYCQKRSGNLNKHIWVGNEKCFGP